MSLPSACPTAGGSIGDTTAEQAAVIKLVLVAGVWDELMSFSHPFAAGCIGKDFYYVSCVAWQSVVESWFASQANPEDDVFSL